MEIEMDTIGFAGKRNNINCVSVEVHVILETTLLYLINIHLQTFAIICGLHYSINISGRWQIIKTSPEF
jgi:hypothetical protein